MNKFSIFLLLLLSSASIKATNNIWVGNGSTNNWSDAGNWSGGTPGINDTVFFNGISVNVNVDLAPNIAGLQVINSSNVILSSGSNVLITIGNLGVSELLVFNIDALSSLTLQGAEISTGVSIQTYGNFTTTRAAVAGTLVLGVYNCSWSVNSFPASFCTTEISGIVRVATGNTGQVISGGLSNGNPGTVSFKNGSSLEWLRNGGSAPNANFLDGSVISIKGITGSNILLNNNARFNGLLVWNCPFQSISGGSAILLPATNAGMDSLRIISTGNGSLRLATNPNGYTINSIEVNGGSLELSAPNSNATSNLTDTITTELKITGGIVYGNATFNFDNLGSAYPNSLYVKGNFTMTGGIFDFTNRAAGNLPGGAFAMHVKGDFLQTGGRIKATRGFGNQNLLELNGTPQQNLALSNITDTISLVINNNAGVSLQNDIAIPYFLNLQKGYLQLNNYNMTLLATRISQASVSPSPSVVTNGNDKLIIGNLAGPQLFPVSPFPGGYNPVTIDNSAPVDRTFSVKVEYGIHPDSVNISAQKLVNRTWNISLLPGIGEPGVNDGSIGLTFQYADSEKVSGATIIPAAAMMLGHYQGSWDYDPPLSLNPSGGPVSYVAGPYSPLSFDSSFILGNAGFIKSIFIFTGDGNWDNAANWANNTIPPDPLPAGKEIIIDPLVVGNCTLNISQTISPGAKIVISKDKKFILPGNLHVQ